MGDHGRDSGDQAAEDQREHDEQRRRLGAPTLREAADIAARWIESYSPHSRRVFGVLVAHARATGERGVGPRPSAEFAAVDPARDLPKAVALLRADAPNRHPYDALLYGMAADVLDTRATRPGEPYPDEDVLVEKVTGALFPDLGDRLTATRAVRVVLDEQARLRCAAAAETEPEAGDQGRPGHWITEECARARARFEQLPRGARPVVTRPVEAQRAAVTPPAPEGGAGSVPVGFPFTPNYDCCADERCDAVWSGPVPRPKVCPNCGGPAIGAPPARQGEAEAVLVARGAPGGLTRPALIAEALRRWGADLREEAGEEDRAARFVGIKLDGAAEAVELLSAAPPAPAGPQAEGAGSTALLRRQLDDAHRKIAELHAVAYPDQSGPANGTPSGAGDVAACGSGS